MQLRGGVIRAAAHTATATKLHRICVSRVTAARPANGSSIHRIHPGGAQTRLLHARYMTSDAHSTDRAQGSVPQDRPAFDTEDDVETALTAMATAWDIAPELLLSEPDEIQNELLDSMGVRRLYYREIYR